MNLANTRWPNKMGDLSDLTFRETYNKNKMFVKYSLKHIREPTGLFSLWMKYLNDVNK